MSPTSECDGIFGTCLSTPAVAFILIATILPFLYRTLQQRRHKRAKKARLEAVHLRILRAPPPLAWSPLLSEEFSEDFEIPISFSPSGGSGSVYDKDGNLIGPFRANGHLVGDVPRDVDDIRPVTPVASPAGRMDGLRSNPVDLEKGTASI